MKVTHSLLAEADIDAIATYIAADSPRAARKLTNDLYDAADALAQLPESFALAPGVENLGIRRRAFGNYSIFFIVRLEDVLVLRVMHSARDYPRLFPAD